jgi:anti-anti-sigma factor
VDAGRDGSLRGAVIGLHGEIDLAVALALALALKAELVEQAGALAGDLVLGCADLTFIDSTGLTALLRVRQQSRPTVAYASFRNSRSTSATG